jgi:hypothetical protein
VKKRSNFNPAVFSAALVSVALPCMTGFTVAAILFLPAPGSSLDAGGTLIFYASPWRRKMLSILLLLRYLRIQQVMEAMAGSSHHSNRMRSVAVSQATANVNELPSAASCNLA